MLKINKSALFLATLSLTLISGQVFAQDAKVKTAAIKKILESKKVEADKSESAKIQQKLSTYIAKLKKAKDMPFKHLSQEFDSILGTVENIRALVEKEGLRVAEGETIKVKDKTHPKQTLKFKGMCLTDICNDEIDDLVRALKEIKNDHAAPALKLAKEAFEKSKSQEDRLSLTSWEKLGLKIDNTIKSIEDRAKTALEKRELTAETRSVLEGLKKLDAINAALAQLDHVQVLVDAGKITDADLKDVKADASTEDLQKALGALVAAKAQAAK